MPAEISLALGLLVLTSFLRPLKAEQTNWMDVGAAIAHWPFDEGSGSTALNRSSNSNTVTIVGATYFPGCWAGALSFNGTNQFAFASDAQSGGVNGSGLDMGTRDWTVSAWVQTTSSGMLLTKMGFMGSGPDGWGVSVSANGNVGVHAVSPRWARSMSSTGTGAR